MPTFEDEYVIGDKLGAGHYSEVFVCTHKKTGDQFAVKVIDKSKSTPKQLLDIMREVDVMKLLSHPHIAHMTAFFDDPSRLLIVMELLAGGEVFAQIVKQKHFSEKVAARMLSNMLGALGFMHSHRIVHRDLKPENLLLTKQSETEDDLVNIKIADLGFAEVVPPSGLTKCCGTPLYIAPEVLNAGLFKTGGPYGVECDMWSIGIITYILLCGYPPFRGKTTTEQFKKIVEGNYSFPSNKVWGHISEEAKDFVSKLIVQDPHARMTAAQALEHPWLKTHNNTHLVESLEELKQFNALKSWRRGVFGVDAVNRILYLSKCTSHGVKPNTDVERLFTECTNEVTILDLSTNYVGAKGLLAVIDLVGENERIEKIVLGNNGVNNAVVEKLCAVLRKHKSVTSVDLSHNSVSHMAGRMLLHLIQMNNRIIELKLEGTQVMPTMLTRIQAQLARNRKGGVQSIPPDEVVHAEEFSDPSKLKEEGSATS
jgi:serine/threonine protein kinase